MKHFISIMSAAALLLIGTSSLAEQIQLGAPAPDFELKDQSGQLHSIEDYRGKWVALYFYPKDDTPGCTTEACEFRDNIFAFKNLECQILGVSLDNEESHKKFSEKYRLPFPLLADTGGTTAAARALVGALPVYVVWSFGAMAALGVTLLAVARTEFGKRHAIGAAAVTIFLLMGILIWMVYFEGMHDPDMVDTIPGRISTLLLIGIFVIPLQPLQTLTLGWAICVFFYSSDQAAQAWGLVSASDAVQPVGFVSTVVMSMLAAALSAVTYRRLFATHTAHQNELRAAKELREAESRLVVSENAASMSRFAATLSHELNTPIGTISSAAQTLHSLAEKRDTLPESRREQVAAMEEELLTSTTTASSRLRDIVARMQRFTNLDRAETIAMDLNDLVRDVLAMCESELKEQLDVQLDLQPLPPASIRPQQIGAVLSNLVQNSVDRAEADRTLRVATRRVDSRIEIEFQDGGRGLSEQEIAEMFEPGFQVHAKRMTGANWSLFSAREMTRQHGGDIHVESPPSGGMTVRVTLPC